MKRTSRNEQSHAATPENLAWYNLRLKVSKLIGHMTSPREESLDAKNPRLVERIQICLHQMLKAMDLRESAEESIVVQNGSRHLRILPYTV